MNVTGETRLLIVDDTPENIEILAQVLSDRACSVALDGPEALAAARAVLPDLILLDVMMPGMDGFEVCRRLKADPLLCDIPVIFVTAQDQVEDEVRGFLVGAVDFVTKPVNPPVVRARVATHLALTAARRLLADQNRLLEERVEERTRELRDALARVKAGALDTIVRLSRAAEYKDDDTGAHVLRMSRFSAAIARRIGWPPDSVETLLHAAPMHDIGKIGIPDRILLKPGKLDPDEWTVMRMHAEMGAKILADSDSPVIRMAEIVASTHHEKWDGSGYPRGLAGEDIPIEGRIVAVADVFDALTTRRPYKEPFSVDESVRILREGRGRHFDPALVDAFLDILPEIIEIKNSFS